MRDDQCVHLFTDNHLVCIRMHIYIYAVNVIHFFFNLAKKRIANKSLSGCMLKKKKSKTQVICPDKFDQSFSFISLMLICLGVRAQVSG